MKRLTTWTSMDGKAKLIVVDGTLSDKLIEQIAIQRLAEYEDAEEQGLLVRLPCKVGDTVYDISEFVEKIPCPEMYEYYADYIGIGKSDDGRTVISIDCTDFYMDDFGKIVFTSREAAEKALEEACRKNT